MNALTWALLGAFFVPAGSMALYGVCAKEHALSRRVSVTVGSTLVIALSTLTGYALTGHYQGWREQRVDDLTDWQLAARLTEARRAVSASPQEAEAHFVLARTAYEAARYDEALTEVNAALSGNASRLEYLVLKVHVLYYKDGRRFSSEADKAASLVLRMDPINAPVHLLYATDAYLHARYPQAIAIWEKLLNSGAAAGNENAIRRAIAKAKAKASENPLGNEINNGALQDSQRR